MRATTLAKPGHFLITRGTLIIKSESNQLFGEQKLSWSRQTEDWQRGSMRYFDISLRYTTSPETQYSGSHQ